MLIQYEIMVFYAVIIIVFLIKTVVIIIVLLHNMIIVIAVVIITVAFAKIFIVAAIIVVILNRKKYLFTDHTRKTRKQVRVMFKLNNKYTKNNINETALLLTLNIFLIFGFK